MRAHAQDIMEYQHAWLHSWAKVLLFFEMCKFSHKKRGSKNLFFQLLPNQDSTPDSRDLPNFDKKKLIFSNLWRFDFWDYLEVVTILFQF